MPEKLGHSIDGIEEYDNPIPAWLMWLLYASIAIAIAYLVLYPGFWKGATGWNQAAMYELEIKEASLKYASAGGAADLPAIINDPTAIARGQEIFAQNCMPCHGADATGGIGPNLTDNAWLYGGTPEEVVHTITNGTAKGMPVWKSQLGSRKIADVAAYVLSLGKGG